MKRGADREMASPQKRPRSLGHEVRVLIPSRVAGSVIGKGGANITRLRSENKATVSVPDCQGPERLLTVGADDQETTLNVLAQILQLIQDDQKRDSQDSAVMEVRALFHHSQVGSIIGKGGSKIKELRESTNAQIKVFGNVCPRSTDRIVAIGGPIDVCIDTVRRLLILSSESPAKGPMERYDPHNFDEYHASEYGGFGEPRGGGGGGGGDFMRGPPRGPPPRYFRPGGGRGRGDGPSRGGGRGTSPGNGFGGPSPPRSYGGGGGMNISGGGGGGGDQGGMSSCQVTIPNEYAGAIIGKGGTRIRRIRADSGAGITIAEPASGQNERIITISGSQGQIRMAQYLLQQSVKEHL